MHRRLLIGHRQRRIPPAAESRSGQVVSILGIRRGVNHAPFGPVGDALLDRGRTCVTVPRSRSDCGQGTRGRKEVWSVSRRLVTLLVALAAIALAAINGG